MDNLVLLLGLAVLIFILCILRTRKRNKLPPGPIGLPIFGYYPFLEKKPVETIIDLSKKYGNIMGLYIGSQYVVFLNNWDAVKDALSQNVMLDKPSALFVDIPYKFGFGGANGAEWVETRRLSSKVMKDALERNNWEGLLQEEMADVVNRLMQRKSAVEPCSFFRDSFTSTVVSLLFGERFSNDDPITKMISSSVDNILDSIATIELHNFSPKLNRFLQILGIKEKPIENSQSFYKFVSDIVDDRIHNPNSEIMDSFISRYQEEIENRQENRQMSYATEDNLKGTVIALLLGGTETTRTTIIWTLIAMADHQDKQKKVHEELDKAIGRDGSIRWSDRSKVPYTLATLMESMRWKTTVPFPLMRISNQDTHIQGYFIPKGTCVISNNVCIHNDTKYWENPFEFKPERFLSDDGRKVNMAPDSFNVFSYGKRNCPGKLLALMDMLQYFSILMQKFQVVPKDGVRVKYEGVLGLSYQARNAELRFIPR